MNAPRFGKTLDRIPSADGVSAELYRSYFRDGPLTSEHWHEESIAVASENEANDVITRETERLIGGKLTDTVSFVIHSDPQTYQISRVVTTYLVERKQKS